jgi:hypothetical protein
MRKLKTVLLAMLVLVAVSSPGWAQYNASKTSIVGSPHDLTHDTWTAGPTGTTDNSITTNLCFFCHIIHKTATNSSGIGTTSSAAPGYMLWNHQLAAPTTYGTYTSDTFQSVLALAGGATGPAELGTLNTISSATASNLCLSCHDGTVAIASFYEQGFGLPAQGSLWYNGHGTAPGGTYMYSGMTINDLTKSHPVHFPYTVALATAAGMTQPASLNAVDAHGAVPLFGNAGFLECPTCHDPHNGTTIPTTGSTAVPFARLALQNAETAQTGGYCTYCHM